MIWFGDIALLLWIPCMVVLFARLRPATATAAALVGANLLLPVNNAFDLPGLPALDRQRIAALVALGCCLFVCPRSTWRLRSVGRPYLLLFALLVAGALASGLSNPDPFTFGNRHVRGMGAFDAFSFACSQILDYGIPFLLGISLVRTRRDLLEVLFVVAVAGILYSIPTLWEIRMSPQLHAQIYGYRPFSFGQNMRGGGFRPVVFMPHGLALSAFLLTCTLAATALWRARVARLGPVPTGLATVYLAAVVALCKSLGTLVYGFVAWPLMLFGSPRAQASAAALTAVVVLSYPILRITNAFPTERIVSAFAFDPNRAGSLQARFSGEDELLERALQRPLLGWGGYGRNRTYNEEGTDVSVTDGFWIIVFGCQGFVGLFALFGMLLLPSVQTRRALHRVPNPIDRRALAGLCVISALIALDLLPNGFITNVALFLAGSIPGALASLALPQTHRAVRPGFPPRPYPSHTTPRESRRRLASATSHS